MTTVITGDIINSRNTKPNTWLKVLKRELRALGETPKQWEIFRGDSFQVEVADPAEALRVALLIKAAIKSIKQADVRLAIGIGDKSFKAKSITQSNGSAFVHSGEAMEGLKKGKVSLVVRSNNPAFDKEMNLYLKLVLVVMKKWTANAAEVVYTALQHPDKSQKALGKLLRIKQNAVSTRLKRACFYELKEVLDLYQQKVNQLS